MLQWGRTPKGSSIFILLLSLSLIITSASSCQQSHDTKWTKNALTPLDRKLAVYVDEIFSFDQYKVLPGIEIEQLNSTGTGRTLANGKEHCTVVKESERDAATARSISSVEEYFYKRWEEYRDRHAVSVNIPETARFLKTTGKSSFLAGFGMGFLAFALKKLLLPVFIGAQLIKSVLIAMFLPSILGSLGKIVGKGLSTFSGVSGSSAGGGLGGLAGGQHMEDFEFKDTGPYNGAAADDAEYNGAESALKLNTINAAGTTTSVKEAMNRYGNANQRIAYLNQQQPYSDNYYFRQPTVKKTDYKHFHPIPSSSLLLTSYDPFYSPLLSRLDAVFQQLGLLATEGVGRGKSAETERCRERLICMMYANPAKYAPYSNLVSAQLSRELNELRKPSSDNPEILRFFKYMKAAKDGQDGEECLAHGGCPSLNTRPAGPAMITSYNDINKLVLARKLN